MPAVLIIGASRGIGRELVRQYLAEGWQVLASYRQPADGDALEAAGAEAIRLDVGDAAASEALAASLKPASLDLVILNAGIYPQGDEDPAHPDEAAFLEGMRINVLAPMRLAALLKPALKPGGCVAFLSSRMGSKKLLESGNALFYRSSKAALNVVVKGLANAWKNEGLRALALHPGWVRTDMGGSDADIDVATSAAGLRQVIAEPGLARSGRFFAYDGAELPW
ncbi:SDR family NAD(P)-dependent oxidoreductase [Chitinimonas lacunae]|uniref:SDR family NAD(P)-dependent oxidoreductase n=1 Tax=Chitinimonas lacunae TaxID=1963018 RepID=A0ABV8MWY9_9NEIS